MPIKLVEPANEAPAPRAFEIYLEVCHRGGTLQEAFNQMVEEGFENDARNMVEIIFELKKTMTLH